MSVCCALAPLPHSITFCNSVTTLSLFTTMPPKKKARTTRASAKKVLKDATPDTEGHGSDASAVAKPRRAVRGRRGGLQDMLNMPMDVLLEIMSLLQPRDLLNLARSTKDYRAFLMSRKSESLWKAARAQVPKLPDIPPGMSEPQYADFMFFTHCQTCLKPNVHAQKVAWDFGTRWCSYKCAQDSVEQNPSILYYVRAELGPVGGDHFLTYEYGLLGCRSEVYHKAQVKEFTEKYNALTKKDDKVALVKEYRSAMHERSSLGYSLRYWAEGCKAQKKDELLNKKQERWDAIKARFIEEGWQNEFAFMSRKTAESLLALPSVNKATKLTSQGWSKVKDDIIPTLELIRQKRLEAEQQAMLVHRLKLLRDACLEHQQASGKFGRPRTREEDYQPLAADLAYMPAFHEMINSPSNVEVTKRSFTELLGSWSDLAAEWFEQRKSEFRQCALRALGGTPAADVKDPLELAIVSFSCGQSPCRLDSGQLRWPQVLAHPCCRRYHDRYYTHARTTGDSAYHAAVFDVFQDSAFNGIPDRMRFASTLEETRAIISACGQDPESVTFAEMEACEARLTCKRCAKPDRCLIMDWRQAVRHLLSEHAKRHGYTAMDATEWELVPEAQRIAANALVPALQDSWLTATSRGEWRYSYNTVKFVCAWCRDFTSDKVKWTTNHVQNTHQVPAPVFEVDYYISDDLRYHTSPAGVWLFSASLVEDEKTQMTVKKGEGFYASLIPPPPVSVIDRILAGG
ncbi:hypothetical protein BD413DRAFT_556637 [Trametes elegans]|nr:hypothetical protein BD413DRAFT_556637 [Trametes elegans]